MPVCFRTCKPAPTAIRGPVATAFFKTYAPNGDPVVNAEQAVDQLLEIGPVIFVVTKGNDQRVEMTRVLI